MLCLGRVRMANINPVFNRASRLQLRAVDTLYVACGLTYCTCSDGYNVTSNEVGVCWRVAERDGCQLSLIILSPRLLPNAEAMIDNTPCKYPC